jgi:hypothetical protein
LLNRAGVSLDFLKLFVDAHVYSMCHSSKIDKKVFMWKIILVEKSPAESFPTFPFFVFE